MVKYRVLLDHDTEGVLTARIIIRMVVTLRSMDVVNYGDTYKVYKDVLKLMKDRGLIPKE